MTVPSEFKPEDKIKCFSGVIDTVAYTKAGGTDV
jgi:hypothetical protein